MRLERYPLPAMPAHPFSPEDRHPPRLRLLLVDDSPQVLRDLRQLLELSEAVEIAAEASDGQAAVLQAAAHAPDVVVMDLEMPGMDGYEATRRIKALRPAPRVVILSVHAGVEERERARVAGADGFVVKGASYQNLLAAILGEDGSLSSIEKGEKP